MIRIAAIVEGHGEGEAVPLLIRRIAREVAPELALETIRPFRVRRNQIVKPDQLRYGELIVRRHGHECRILVLLDANGDCPASFGPELRARTSSWRSDVRVEVVLAKSEYEAWFLAALDSLRGQRRIQADAMSPDEPEEIRDAKGRLRQETPRNQPYDPVDDQAALTRLHQLAAVGDNAALGRAMQFLGLLPDRTRHADIGDGAARELIDTILAARAAARRAHDYALADRLRDDLQAAGVVVKDGVDGSEWSPVGSLDMQALATLAAAILAKG